VDKTWSCTEGSTDKNENPNENDQYMSKPIKRCSTKRYSPESNKKKKIKMFLSLPVSASSPLSKQLLTPKSTSSFNCLPLQSVPSTSVLTKPTQGSLPSINNQLLTSNSSYSESGKDLI